MPNTSNITLDEYSNAINAPLVEGLLQDPESFILAVSYLTRFQEGRGAIQKIPTDIRRQIEIKLLKGVPLTPEETEQFVFFQSVLTTQIKQLSQMGEDVIEMKHLKDERNTTVAVSTTLKPEKENTSVHHSWIVDKHTRVEEWKKRTIEKISADQQKALESSLNTLDDYSSTSVNNLLTKEAERLTGKHIDLSPLTEDQKRQEALLDARSQETLARMYAASAVVDLASRDLPFINQDIPLGQQPASSPDLMLYANAQMLLNKHAPLRNNAQQREKIALRAVESAKFSEITLPESLSRNDPEISQRTLVGVLEQKLGSLDTINTLIDSTNPEAVNSALGAILFIDAFVATQDKNTSTILSLFFESDSFDQFRQFMNQQANEKNNASFLGVSNDLFAALTRSAADSETNTFLPYIMGISLSDKKGQHNSLLEQLLHARSLAGESTTLTTTEAAKHFALSSNKQAANSSVSVPSQLLLPSLLQKQLLFNKVTNRFFSLGRWIDTTSGSQNRFTINPTIQSTLSDGLSIVGSKIMGVRSSRNIFSFFQRVFTRNFGSSGAVRGVLFSLLSKNPFLLFFIGFLLIVLLLLALPLISTPGDLQRDLLGPALQQAGGGGESKNENSKYISVSKTASATQFPSNNAGTITYTITIQASIEQLTNITIQDSFSVFSQTNTTPPQTQPISPPETIVPGSPFTTTYSVDLSAYKDALVTNTLTIKADTSSSTEETSVATEEVLIGNPPTGCFNFSGWPEQDKNLETQVATALTIKQPGFMAKLCSGGTVTLFWHASHPSGYGGCVGMSCVGKENWSNAIAIYKQNGLGNFANAFYTLSHELGHIFAFRNGAIYNSFENTVPNVKVCTYPFNTSNFFVESFAESVALYFGAEPNGRSVCMTGGTFQTGYPQHWQFMNDIVF